MNLSTGRTGEGFAPALRVHRKAWDLLPVAGPQATPTISPFESMPVAVEPSKPGGRKACKSTMLAMSPRHNRAWLSPPEVEPYPNPTCCPPETPEASDRLNPLGWRSTTLAALPVQRRA